MIVAVTGVLSAAGGDWVHLMVGGVTLQLYVPASDIAALGDIGSQVHLFTHLRMRDDQPVLYGFSTPAALELFLVTQGVSGVGPRLGLALLSGLGAAGLQQAITEGDVATLSGISGVGRRIAGRIVLELKGKLELELGDVAGIPAGGGMDGEVIAALTALGYSTAEAPPRHCQPGPLPGNDGGGLYPAGAIADWGELAQMGKFFVRSKQAAGPEDWRAGLAKPNKQWKTGKSAKALAHSWEKSDGFPPEVKKVFDESGFGVLKEIDLLRGDVEYVVPLPGGAAGSQNDILVHAKSDSNRIVIAVEGKVSEDFGPRVKSWIKKISPKSGKPKRLQFLQERLEIESRNVRAIRYQLLHRTASALN